MIEEAIEEHMDRLFNRLGHLLKAAREKSGKPTKVEQELLARYEPQPAPGVIHLHNQEPVPVEWRK